jgi:hypothetical protein
VNYLYSTILIMLRVVNLIVFVCSLLIPVFSGGFVAAEDVTTPSLIITEVKVRYDTTLPFDYDEFIELYNASDTSIDLADFYLEYYNATNPSLTQQPVQKPLFQSLLGVGEQLILAKQPLQIPNSQQSPFSSLSDSGGRLKIVSSEGIVIDEVAWANSSALASTEGVYPVIVYQCNSSTILCSSNRSKSISRSLDLEGDYIVLNASWSLATPSPESSELMEYPVSDPVPISPPDPVIVPTPLVVPTCEGIILSEILPNPAGSDTGHEFIELYNPTNETISLKGCLLQTSANSVRYNLPDIAMEPGTYIVFNDAVTGLTLPNSAGGTVWLLSPTEELSTTIYPSSMEDDASWSYMHGQWQISYTFTPGVANVILDVKSCPDGQVRSTITNRCQNTAVTAVATLTSCKVGQERNPETGRCRGVASTVSTLVACKAGQERNPETNRCRTASSNELTPCPEGQERNPDTNRCRKVTNSASSTLAAVTDVPTASVSSHPKWWLAIAAVTVALGYAAFEWRRDVLQLIQRLKAKFGN